MNKFLKKLLIILFLFCFLVIFFIFKNNDFRSRNLDENQVSSMGKIFDIFSSFLGEEITTEDLKDKYKKGDIKILIVPGHDLASPGAIYKNIKEEDLNTELAYQLHEFFKEDKKFKSYITRDEDGLYTGWFVDYITREKESVSTFRDYTKSMMSFLFDEGVAEKEETSVVHNPAADNTSLNLYAINKLADENNVDIVIHVHFNDYPTRSVSEPGKYTGFAIYVPGEQLPNHNTSFELAGGVKEELEKYFAKSNFPGEKDVIVKDDELIAVGSNGSRKGASLLIEYGYIYESKIMNEGVRLLAMQQMATQTYIGIKKFFDTDFDLVDGVDASSVSWDLPLKKGLIDSKDVFVLQKMLADKGFYPPSDKTLSDCPISGNFGSCTYFTVCEFQKESGLSCSGVVDEATMKKLVE